MVNQRLVGARLDICYWFFYVVTVLSLAALVSWLSLTPRNPSFTLSDAHFPASDSMNHSIHLNVSVPNNSLVFHLQVFNPNKRMGIYYSGISFELYTSGGVMGTYSIPAFYQGYKNTTLFQIPIHPKQEFWQAMNSGNVDFRIRLESFIRFLIIKWRTKVHQISYEERFSKVKTSLNGTVSGGNYAELQNASKVNIRN